MIRFHIGVGESGKNFLSEESWQCGFRWRCYANNNRFLFGSDTIHYRFRNCVNAVRIITKNFRVGSYCIIVTKEADILRRAYKEPLYGIKNGQCL